MKIMDFIDSSHNEDINRANVEICSENNIDLKELRDYHDLKDGIQEIIAEALRINNLEDAKNMIETWLPVAQNDSQFMLLVKQLEERYHQKKICAEEFRTLELTYMATPETEYEKRYQLCKQILEIEPENEKYKTALKIIRKKYDPESLWERRKENLKQEQQKLDAQQQRKEEERRLNEERIIERDIKLQNIKTEYDNDREIIIDNITLSIKNNDRNAAHSMIDYYREVVPKSDNTFWMLSEKINELDSKHNKREEFLCKMKLLQDFEYQEGLDICNQYLDIDPNDSEFRDFKVQYLIAGFATIPVSNYQERLNYCTEILTLVPENKTYQQLKLQLEKSLSAANTDNIIPATLPSCIYPSQVEQLNDIGHKAVSIELSGTYSKNADTANLPIHEGKVTLQIYTEGLYVSFSGGSFKMHYICIQSINCQKTTQTANTGTKIVGSVVGAALGGIIGGGVIGAAVGGSIGGSLFSSDKTMPTICVFYNHPIFHTNYEVKFFTESEEDANNFIKEYQLQIQKTIENKRRAFLKQQKYQKAQQKYQINLRAGVGSVMKILTFCGIFGLIIYMCSSASNNSSETPVQASLDPYMEEHALPETTVQTSPIQDTQPDTPSDNPLSETWQAISKNECNVYSDNNSITVSKTDDNVTGIKTYIVVRSDSISEKLSSVQLSFDDKQTIQVKGRVSEKGVFKLVGNKSLIKKMRRSNKMTIIIPNQKINTIVEFSLSGFSTACKWAE